MAQAQIDELWIYPIKSCRGIRLRSARLAARGFAGDREWMLVDAHDRFITQRSHPQLAGIVPTLTQDSIALTAAGHDELTLPRHERDLSGAARTVQIWRDTVTSIDAGEQAARWCSRVVGAPVRLVRATQETRREPQAQWRDGHAAPVNFPDAFPLLVCNSASLAELNRRMAASLPMSRFRPNVVISGPAAFAEDRIAGLRADAVHLRLTKPCSRCSTTAVDQLTGIPGVDPLPALKEFRFNRELLGVMFGKNAVIASGVGEELREGPITSSD